MGVQCQGTSWNCQGRHGKEKQLAVNALKFEMLVQATVASTVSALVGLAVPTWASLQVLLAGDLVRQGSWLRYWLVFAIAELLTLPVPYMKVFFLREEFAKASCSFMEDGDYEEGEKITIKYSLKRKFKIFLLRIRMKLYEMIES